MPALRLVGPRRAEPSPPRDGRPAGIAVFDRVADVRAHLDAARAHGRRVGLVPTMGSLHEGHLSLVRRAAAECDAVAVTVFVNPLQFGPGEDFESYPRHLDADIELAAGAGATVVFAPSVAEMYPTPARATVEVGDLADVYEGASRPGHFTGVATVVAKLLHAAGPCRAYFGEKDWQQVLVVRRMVADLLIPVEVVTCPTVRDHDGLACSSRNARLNPDERRAARSLFEALSSAAALVDAGERDPEAVRLHLAATIAREPLVALYYADVVHAHDLTPLEAAISGDARLIVAARVGGTRLIDNLALTTAAPGES